MIKYIRFHFKEPFHIGSEVPGGDPFAGLVIHSDTLMGGILFNWIKLFGDTSGLEGFLNGNPPFLVSSVFPVLGDNFFLPKPKIISDKEKEPESEKEMQMRKKYKRVKLVPVDILKLYLEGKKVDKEVIIEQWEKLSASIENYTEPRVRLGPQMESSQIFYITRARTTEELDYYLFVDIKDASLTDKLVASLKLLAENGLGGFRSKGNGRFELKTEKILEDVPETVKQLSSIETNGTFMLISLLSPSTDSFQKEKSCFELIIRGGGWALNAKTGSQGLKKRVKMLIEGTILVEKDPGQNPDVTPSEWKEKIFQYGMGFYVPLT